MSDTPVIWVRGLFANLPLTGVDGTWYYCTDTNQLFYGSGLTPVAGSALTGSGNKVVATPANGSSGASALRALVAADIPSLPYDSSGSAASAQSNAETFSTSSIAVETARAEAAEALLAPINFPTFVGTVSSTSVAGDALLNLGSLVFVDQYGIASFNGAPPSFNSGFASVNIFADERFGNNALIIYDDNPLPQVVVDAFGNVFVYQTLTVGTLVVTGTATGITAAMVGADASGLSAAETTRAEAAEALLAPKASPTFTGTVSGITAAMVGAPTTAAMTTAIGVETTRAEVAEALLAPPTITGGNTVGGLLLTSAADWSGLLPPGDPANIGVNLWIKGSGTKDTYLVLQSGQSPTHARNYINFMDYDGAYKWLMGKNGSAGTNPNQFILYDAVTDIHRMIGDSAANGTGGNTYLAAGGVGAVVVNGNDGVSDTSCTGGFQVWGGGSGGTGAVKRFVVLDNGNVGIGNSPSCLLDVGTSGTGASGQFQVSTTAITASLVPFVADNAAGYQWGGSGNTNAHFSTTNSTIILTSGGSSPSHDILGVNAAHGVSVNGNVFFGFTPTSDVTAAQDTTLERLAAGVIQIGGTAGAATGTVAVQTITVQASSGAPTSAGTAGTVGQIVAYGGSLYFCSVTGAAGSATWNKLNMTAV